MAAALVAAALLLPSAAAVASPSDPTQWPEQAGADPELSATANTIRFAGADRYQTNLALGLALRGSGQFPFDTSDRTGGGVTRLAQAKQWWGAASCPRSIIVVAGDTIADALAAASLSDPTDRSTQPRATRVASSDPQFNPIGGTGRIDTAFAPVVVTTSARGDATTLAPSARTTAADLAKGGCTVARQAIIVGGAAAVPTGVESELVGLGYDEVFRVAGADRYETAARVAAALGTGTPPPAGTPCLDPTTSDGQVQAGFYGNAVIEYRSGPDTCLVYGRTVVLADGLAGIDALAAGWWTSYWQVPVLLTGPGGTLPEATRAALETLDVDTIVVLGGTGRIPESTIQEAKALTGAVAGAPAAGNDRFISAVKMAQVFGGWYPAPNATFADDRLCVTSSSGPVGSPDALAAGPLCGRFAAARTSTPVRAQLPTEGEASRTLAVGGVAGGHTFVPVLLVPTGGSVPASVSDLLRRAFGAPRCTGSAAPTGCASAGFAVVVGGGVSATAVGELGELLGDLEPRDRTPVANTFVTRLDLRPVFDAVSTPRSPQVCAGSDGLANVRWLSFSTDKARRTFLGQRDVLRDGWYAAGASTPRCQVLPAFPSLTVSGVGVGGQVGTQAAFDLSADAALAVSAPIVQVGPSSVVGPSAGVSTTTWSFDARPEQQVSLVRAGVYRELIEVHLGLDLTSRVASPGVAVAAGRVQFATGLGQDLTGTIRADARLVGDAWELAGVVELGPLGGQALRGGFRATVTTAGDGQVRASWVVDGIPTT